VECEVDIQCKYARNPNFHLTDDDGNPIPYLDGMQNIIIPDVQARFAAWRGKKFDSLALSSEQRIVIERKNPEVRIDESRSFNSWFIHFRTDQAPWNDKRVRQAVSKAIDRVEIMETLFDSRYHFLLGMVMPSDDTYLSQDELHEAYRQDIPGCKQLLGDAGFPNGLDATMWIANYADYNIATAELFQQHLKECGINIDLFIHDRPTYLSRVFTRHGEFEDMAYGPQGSFTADAWLNAYYHSEGGRNSSWVNDPVLDKMIADQHTELNKEKRSQVLIDIQRYLLDQMYQAVIYSSLSQTGVWPWNMNRTLSASGDYPAGRADNYYWIDQAIFDKYK